jgi:multidrug efflux pump subunit AcrA (membrane-fusion protein)
MLGAIVIEQLVDSRPPEGLLQRVDVVRRHSSTALTNAQSHEGLFLLPLWRFIGKSRVLVAARNLPKTIAAAIGIAIAIAALWLFPYDFTIVANGRLLPETRRYVFAALDGMVIDVPVDNDQTVAKGQEVATQQSLDLEGEITKLRGDIEKNQKDIDSAKTRRRLLANQQTARDLDYDELTSEIRRLEKDQQSLEKQRLILEQKQRKLHITSPIDGKVVTWKVRDLIEGRPVRTGTRLMEIADPRKDWQLEIEVPESKMGHVVRYLNKIQKADPKASLEVTFILATDPAIKLVGKVSKINTSAEVSGDTGNTVRMDVAFDQQELLKLLHPKSSDAPAAANMTAAEKTQAVAELKKNLKVGADVKAKLHCGRAPIGYVWFHELWEFIQSRILFRF